MSEIVKVCKKHGELTKEFVSNEKGYKGKTKFRCIFCRRECSIRSDLKNLDKRREAKRIHMKEYRANMTREQKDERNRKEKILREKNLPRYNELSRKRRLRRKEKDKYYRLNEAVRIHGITGDQYKEMLINQNNLCKICNQPETRKSRTKGEVTRLAVDHCHQTNTIRGLLCHDCNTGLGKFKDNQSLLMDAIVYLDMHQELLEKSKLKVV